MLRKTQCATLLQLAWLCYPNSTWAEMDPGKVEDSTRLPEITVSSKQPGPSANKQTQNVTRIQAEKIEEEGARDIKDVFEASVDVSVRAAPTRFKAAGSSTGRAGNEGINIRGLGGNQVLMLIDGVPVPNGFTFGSFATGRGDYISVDGIKTVTVLRGPAASHLGSDGLAGAVSFRTLDPSDLLKNGQPMGGFLRSGQASIDQTSAYTLGAAANIGRWQTMVLGSQRDGHEVSNMGTLKTLVASRTAPNPVNYAHQYWLAKAQFQLDATQRFGLTVETQKRRQDTKVFTARALPPLTDSSTLDLKTHDHIRRDRVSLEQHINDINAPWVQRADLRIYQQEAQVNQLAIEDRNVSVDRTRDNTFSHSISGLSARMESQLTSMLNQKLGYGFDWSRAEISGLRDGTFAPFGGTFPIKPFPDTIFTQSGAFVQSEIETEVFSIAPGLRFSYYDLNPSAEGYDAGPVKSLSGQAVTPRIGAVWRLAERFVPYAQLAKGFRAPTPNQVNNGFTNLASGYRIIGNPNLKAETAYSLEIGMRGALQNGRYGLAIYSNLYENFISQQLVSGVGTTADPFTIQHINLGEARIQGVEVRTEWLIGKRWKASADVAYSKGEGDIQGESKPLDTVQPLKSVIGLRFDDALWGARAHLIYSTGKEVDQISTGSAKFAPPSYMVLDMGMYWKPMPMLSLYVNLNNVFNTTYWRWSDVSGLASESNVKEAYTAPGRNLQLSARYDF